MNKLNILYEDNHIIVVEKPVNVLSQSDITNDPDMLTIIKEYLKEKYHKPGNVYLGLVHRLDRIVGGIMVFAKTSKAAARLSSSVREKDFDKEYLAVCHGKVLKEDTFIDYLKKEDDYRTVVSNKDDGKLSELSYELLEYKNNRDVSLIRVKLKTGRHHQIRVQFASRNHPLVGDHRYGNDLEKEIGLFAYKLSFTHPVKKEKMTFVTLPEKGIFKIFDLKKLIKK